MKRWKDVMGKVRGTEIFNRMKKINTKLQVRPKFFWGGIIVILLIMSTSFYILKEKERALRIYTQNQLTLTNKEKEAVEAGLIETIGIKEIVEKELVAEKERSLTLEKEVKEKEKQIRIVLNRLDEEIATRCEAEAQLIVAMEEKEGLEERLKKLTILPKTIELERIVVKPASMAKIAPKLLGRILMVNKEYAFVVINLGRENNLKLGDMFSVYRDDEFIGKVQVQKVKEGISAALILPDWQNEEFKKNDEVSMI